MNEIIRTRNALTPYVKKNDERTSYNFKRQAVQNSLYGVDIDSGAVEIAKLRLWLSLVVDEEERERIQPLPNLDYKIVQGNSLIELLSLEHLQTSTDQKRNQLVQGFKGLKNELFSVTSLSLKKQKRKEIENLINQLFEHDRQKEIKELKHEMLSIQSQNRLFEDKQTIKEDENKIQEIKNKINDIKNLKIPDTAEHFEWHINFSEVFQEEGGFDIVIANPPWVVIRHKEVSKNIISYLKNRYTGAAGFKVNLFPIFVELSLELIKNNGVTTLIIPNRLLDTPSYRGIREKFINKYRILDIENLPGGGFNNVVAGNIVLIIQKRVNDLKKIFVKNFYTKSSLEIPIKDVLSTQNLTININLNPIAVSIIAKIDKENNLKLKEICNIHVGLMIKNKRDLLVDEPIYKDRIVTGKCLAKYNISSKKYFDYGQIEIFGGTKDKAKHLETPKLFIRKTGNQIICALDTEGIFAEQSVYLMLLRNRNFDKNFVNAFLNSSLATFYFQNKLITNPESYPYLQHYDLENMPVIILNQQQQKPFIEIVDKILALTKDENYLKNTDKQAKVKEYEKQIDKMVYKLYGLTDEEIKTVENATRK
jgi:hypothetical protein